MQLRVRQQHRSKGLRAFSLRERGLKWREIAESMGCAEALLRCACGSPRALAGTRRGRFFEFQPCVHPLQSLGGMFFEGGENADKRRQVRL